MAYKEWLEIVFGVEEIDQMNVLISLRVRSTSLLGFKSSSYCSTGHSQLDSRHLHAASQARRCIFSSGSRLNVPYQSRKLSSGDLLVPSDRDGWLSACAAITLFNALLDLLTNDSNVFVPLAFRDSTGILRLGSQSHRFVHHCVS